MNFRQVHLDFHTSEKINGIGEKFSKENFQKALKEGHVNSITVFSKCHHGWAYHPSEANEMHPGLNFDLLAAQIEAAHEIGVKTPVYLSAGLDEKFARKHTQWLVRSKNEATLWVKDFSQPGYHKLCMNTPYLDYLLKQVEEVVKNYDADGIFLDIVGPQPCYCMNCINSLEAEGLDPYNEENHDYLADKVYKNYAKRIRETIDSVKPGLPVFHNSGHIQRGRRDYARLNTHLELESLPTGGWGYDHFPMSARYVQNLGMEYLGMTGKFHTTWGEFGGFKHENALRYETALSAANGAKCSVGDQLAPNGEMDAATYKLIGAAYSELEQKEPWLDSVKNIADVALLSADAVNISLGVNRDGSMADVGASRILLEGHYLFDIIDSEENFDKYKVVVLPDILKLTPDIREKLKNFVKNGGKLLASGISPVENGKFAFDFGAEYLGENEYNPDYCRPKFAYSNVEDTGYIFYGKGYKIKNTGGKELAVRENPYFNRAYNHFCSHQHSPNSREYGGSGIIEGADGIYIAWEIFGDYADKASLILKRCVCYALDRLLGAEKTITTDLPAQGVVTFMRQEASSRYVCHLLYASPVRRGTGIEVIEDILPVYNINVEINVPEKVKNVYLAPQNIPLDFETTENDIRLCLDKLECHQMIILDY